eukprot:scaffold1147_cov68-Phaeocystis_antarctica.AAC.14
MSIRETTPSVTDRARGEHGVSGSADRWVASSSGGQLLDMLSPPTGKPTTVTTSCSRGRSVAPRSTMGRGVGLQKAASVTVSSARSQSRAIATTSAMYLLASPRFFTLTTAKLSTQCAFVRMRLPLMMKPVEVDVVWWRYCQGSE